MKNIFLITLVLISVSVSANDCPELSGDYRMSLDNEIINLKVTQEQCKNFDFKYTYYNGSIIQYRYNIGQKEPAIIYNDAVRSIKVVAEIQKIIIGNRYELPALKLNITEHSKIYEDTLKSVSYFYSEQTPQTKSLVERRDYLKEDGKYFYRVYMGYSQQSDDSLLIK
ncbi:MAG: hypothetical protein HOO06_10000 [Bdellovibrionaceae bacterium]|jgi:hypothetical protein|nr:hypothetical protein [Pseudobdellovibrionaceae bacterium]